MSGNLKINSSNEFQAVAKKRNEKSSKKIQPKSTNMPKCFTLPSALTTTPALSSAPTTTSTIQNNSFPVSNSISINNSMPINNSVPVSTTIPLERNSKPLSGPSNSVDDTGNFYIFYNI